MLRRLRSDYAWLLRGPISHECNITMNNQVINSPRNTRRNGRPQISLILSIIDLEIGVSHDPDLSGLMLFTCSLVCGSLIINLENTASSRMKLLTTALFLLDEGGVLRCVENSLLSDSGRPSHMSDTGACVVVCANSRY